MNAYTFVRSLLIGLLGFSALQQNSSAPIATEAITIAAVGDVMIGSTYPDDSALPPNDGKDLMTPFAPVPHAADLTFGNLEGPMLEGGVSTKCPPPPPPPKDGPTPAKVNCFAFRVPTRYGKDLTDAGFAVMSLANNHAGDSATRAGPRHARSWTI